MLIESTISLIDRFAPLEKSKSQTQSWVTDSTKKVLKNRDRVPRKWVQNLTESIKLKHFQGSLATKIIRNEQRVCSDKKLVMVEIQKKAAPCL